MGMAIARWMLTLMLILVAVVTFGLMKFFPAMMGGNASNKTMSIGVGGAYGVLMLLNVWGIIWPANKRIIGALQGGPAADPLARPRVGSRRERRRTPRSAWLRSVNG